MSRRSASLRATHRSLPVVRRGFAMLLVLVALLVCVAGSVALVRVRLTERLASAVERRARTADDLARGVEPVLAAWLARDADNVVLPPDALLPAVLVLDDSWKGGAGPSSWRLRAIAIDQSGLLPWNETSGPLALAVEDRVRSARARAPGAQPPGLDLLPPGRFGDIDAFPRFSTTVPIEFGASSLPDGEIDVVHGGSAAGDTEAAITVPSLEAPSVGTSFATLPQSRDNGILLNVNTAPRDLLERAYRRAGRGGAEMILDARERGERTTLQVGTPTGLQPGRRAGAAGSTTGRQGQVVFVGSSDAWAFLVEATVDGLTRRWWTVWSRDSSNGWKIIQRLEVDE